MKYLKNIKNVALSLVLPMALVSCTEVWNDHSDVDSQKQSADKTLWEEIESHPELQGFAECLKQYNPFTSLSFSFPNYIREVVVIPAFISQGKQTK